VAAFLHEVIGLALKFGERLPTRFKTMEVSGAAAAAVAGNSSPRCMNAWITP